MAFDTIFHDGFLEIYPNLPKFEESYISVTRTSTNNKITKYALKYKVQKLTQIRLSW